MFEKAITFKASERYLKNCKDIYPVPAKANIPDWFKKLEHGFGGSTVKGCIPFLDTLIAGYILKMPVEYRVEHNVDTDGIKNTGFESSQKNSFFRNEININYDKNKTMHQPKQFVGSPFVEKNKNLPIHKIMNPWIIKTPPGYSCLFVPPLNNHDDRFEIIPGIVDTDTYDQEINFPILFNGDKYPVLNTVIKRGTPYVQIIPFKRDKWKMKIKGFTVEERIEKNFFYEKLILNNYKNFFWSKKSWR